MSGKKSQIYQLGQQIKQREVRLARLQNDDRQLSDQLSILRSPTMLDRRARELNLGLAPAQPMQVMRLAEPVSAPPENKKFDAPVCGKTRWRNDPVNHEYFGRRP